MAKSYLDYQELNSIYCVIMLPNNHLASDRDLWFHGEQYQQTKETKQYWRACTSVN